MPLSDIQRDILRLLASHRDPESHVARAVPLNENGPRHPAFTVQRFSVPMPR